MPGVCRGGSFVCEAGHELRITSRCLRADLDREPPQAFAELAEAHPIVHSLSTKRDSLTHGGKTVGPASGARTLFHLGQGNDHRGATWFDHRERVVWLCGYRWHRSGHAADAFPYFHRLLRSGEIWPTQEDYAWLETDHAERLAEELPEVAQSLLQQARAAPNVEYRAVIGTGGVGLVVEVVATLEETYVAVRVATMGDPTRLVALLAAFYPDRNFDEWASRTRLPTRHLGAGEICLSILNQ
ncbi:MAG TPA: hypothetical protein VNG12_26185 [Acidimicrobiales bacterium]|nr:hypothetical protein [Acidimicrobiales bacterium]